MWIKLFLLRLRQPNEYHWVIPIPGAWHWTWHIIKGIYLVYYDSILLPFSAILGYSSLDKEANNFHYAEDFLEIVTMAVFQWITRSLQAHSDKDITGYTVLRRTELFMSLHMLVFTILYLIG